MDIRAGTFPDLDELVRLRMLMFQAMGYGPSSLLQEVCEESRVFFRETIPPGGFRFWMAETDGQAVGAVGMVVHQVPPAPRNRVGREAYLMNLVVVPEHWRRGIGRALLLHALAVARNEGIAVASLHAAKQAAPCTSGWGLRAPRPLLR